jgi:hypothetical protein
VAAVRRSNAVSANDVGSLAQFRGGDDLGASFAKLLSFNRHGQQNGPPELSGPPLVLI